MASLLARLLSLSKHRLRINYHTPDPVAEPVEAPTPYPWLHFDGLSER
ncbi:MAG: hypothetical protein ACOYXB_14660 [Bacteroidota bacterium]